MVQITPPLLRGEETAALYVAVMSALTHERGPDMAAAFGAVVS
jgi:hypothetical protein